MRSVLLLSFLIAVALQDASAQAGLYSWQPVTYANGTSPQGRHEDGFVEANGKFYLLGGRNIKNVNIYDPATRIWTNGAPPPIELHHFQAIVYQNKIYLINAMTGAYPTETPVPNVYIYDIATNTWSMGPAIPVSRRRGSSGAVLYNNKIYLICGIQNGHTDGWVNWVDSFDLTTNTWTTLANAPQARDHFFAVLLNGKIYAVAGRRTAQPNFAANTVAALDVYDIASNSWTTPTSIPTPRGAPGVSVVNNEIVVAGGEVDYSGSALAIVEAYNTTTNTWVTRSPLNVGRHATQMINYGGYLYLAAGSTTQGGGGENGTMASALYTAATGNAAPFVAQVYGNKTVPSTQATLVIPMSTIFGDDGGVANLTFALAGNTNAALVTSSTVAAGNLTLNLSGVAGTGTITLRATDAATPALSTTTTFVLTVNASTANVAPFIAQAYGNKTVPSTQTSLVIPMSTIFGDDGGVANLTFAMSGNTNAALVTSTSVAGGNLTLNLSGTAGSGTITLRATDAGAPVLSTTTTFLLTVTAPTTTTLTNVVRINAGGAAQTFGTEGWVADQYFTGGSTYSTAAAIANTTSDPIYQTERFGTFTYHIPVTGAGTYAVDLHLAEIYQTTAGTRVFNVNVENGQFIRNNLDLISAIGPINTAGVIRADNLNITDGFIDITFTTVVDNAKVSGIAVSKYSTTNSAPFIAQPYANQTVLSTQATLVIPMSTIFGDDGGVANLTFALAGNTNAALVTSSSVASGNLTLNLSGTTGTGTVTLRATDAATPALSTTTTFTLTVNASTTNAAPFIAQAYGNQTVPSTQTTLVVPMSTIFGDDGGVANLTFALAGNTNAALVTSSAVAAGNLTLNLSGITGSGTITLRATDAATPALSTTTTFVLLVNSPVVTLTTLLRINSGGSAQTFGTEVWLADQYFTGGFLNGTSAAIANTTSDAVYQNERFGNFSYHIPVPSSGSYAVDLHLAEIYWIEPGKRSFNISVENGQFVRNNLDLITTYGSINTAAILRADNINVTDGFIDITFTNVLDNAKVSGITISRYSASGTSGRIAMESNTSTLTPPSTTAEQVYNTGEALFALYPNPAERTFSIRLNAKVKDTWNFVLTDIVGRPIDLGSKEFTEGTHVVEFDVSSNNLNSGMYFMSVRTSRGRETIKIALK